MSFDAIESPADMDPGTFSEELQIRSEPPPLWKSFLAWAGFTLLIAAGMFPVMKEGRPDDPDEHLLIAFFALAFGAVVSGVTVFAMRGGRDRQPTYLRLDPDAVCWRKPPQWFVLYPYAALWSAHLEGDRRRERLAIRSVGNQPPPFLADVEAFTNPAAVEPLLENLYERVRALPNGTSLVEAMAVRREVATRSRQTPRVTFGLATLMALVFLIEIVTGALGTREGLLALGANSAERVAQGEWFRLATATFLHGGIYHVAMNTLVLLGVGRLLEPLLGTARFLTVFLASALAGGAASALIAQHDVAVGASTGIAGLIGAYAIIAWRWPHQLPDPPTRARWIGLATGFLLPALVFRNVDHAGHLGGLTAGCLVMMASAWGTDLLNLRRHHRLPFQIAAAVLSVLFLSAFALVASGARLL